MSVKQRLAAVGLSASLILAGGTLIAPWEGKEKSLQGYRWSHHSYCNLRFS
jgi:hypothetical protein